MNRSGRCLCGAVSFDIQNAPPTFNVCHCDMCRRWTGARFYGYAVPKADLMLKGDAAIVERETSEWAARANCGTCGSPLWYRPLRDGADYVCLSTGLLDDTAGLALAHEFFVDCKATALDPTDETLALTTAQTIAKFAPADEGEPL